MTAVLERAAAPCALRDLESALGAVVAESEREVEQLAHDFEGLARETSTILEIAGVIAGCAGDERMGSVLPGVRRLASAAKGFLRERVEATARILETVTAEGALLERLARLTRGQKAIVRETEMLRVLTNIEVARLGEVGAGFQYLAHELDDFAQSVARSTNELTRLTDERRKAIDETRRSLTAEVPRMREEFARVEQSLETAVASVEAALEQLFGTPVRFSGCVEEIASQIAGVVAAIQAHDITRQQIEHVQAALLTIAAELEGEGGPSAGTGAGLAIQSYQLRSVRETVRGWTAQISTCLEAIGHITSSEILELGPVVLAQQRALGGHLARIERLEEECEADNAQGAGVVRGDLRSDAAGERASGAIEGGAGPAAAADVQLHRRSQPSGVAGGRDSGDLDDDQAHFGDMGGDHDRLGSSDGRNPNAGGAEPVHAGGLLRSQQRGPARGARRDDGGPWGFARRGRVRGSQGAGDSEGDARVAGENRGGWRPGASPGGLLSAPGRGRGRNRGGAAASGRKRATQGTLRSMRKRWSVVSRRTTRQRWSARCCGRRSKEGRCRWRSRISRATAWSFSNHRCPGFGARRVPFGNSRCRFGKTMHAWFWNLEKCLVSPMRGI